jgi:hypothetical protein
VGGNPPQTQKPRSHGAWPLNPTDVRGVKRCPGPARPLAGPASPGHGLGLAMVVAVVPYETTFFSLMFLVFSVLHMFCIFFLVFHVLHMYLFETLFSWRFSLFLCSNVWFQNFVQIGSIVEFFFFTSISSN